MGLHRALSAAARLWLVLAQPLIVSANVIQSGCPPCRGEQALFAQIRPWRNFVPPAPDAPLTPCGCAAGAAARRTPRNELRDMSDGTLEQMKAQLEDKISKAESELAAAEEEQGDMLKNLRGRVGAVRKAIESHKASSQRGHDKVESEHAASQTKVDEVEAEIATLSTAMEEDKAALRELRARLAGLVEMAVGRCAGCKLPSIGLLAASSAVGRVVAQDEPDVQHEFLVRDIEELEARYQALQKAISDGALQFGIQQRRLLDEADAAKLKKEQLRIDVEEADHVLDGKTKRLAHQLKAANVFRDRQADATKKLQQDMSAVKEKTKDLEDAMRRCKCL